MRARSQHVRNMLPPLDGLLNALEGRIRVPIFVNHQKTARARTLRLGLIPPAKITMRPSLVVLRPKSGWPGCVIPREVLRGEPE